MADNPLAPLSKATSIGPDNGRWVPNDTQGSPLTAKSLPDLLSRYVGDPTDPGNIAGTPAGVGPAVLSDDLIKSLLMMKHSLGAGEQVGKAAVEGPPSSLAKILIEHLANQRPPEPNIGTLAALDKVTGATPPTSFPIAAPEGFKFQSPMAKFARVGQLAPKRDPNMESISKVWDASRAMAERPYDVASKIPQDRPKLSGRWLNRNKSTALNTNAQLNAIYKPEKP